MMLHFISQLNLSTDNARNNLQFLKYLAEHMGKIDALYLIDHVFDVWTGDENRHHVTEELLQALQIFTQHTPVFIQTGYHDFLIGHTFAQRTGVTLLPAIATVQHNQQHLILVSASALTTWHPDYKHLRQQLQLLPCISISPAQQQQKAQQIVQMAALNDIQLKHDMVQQTYKQYGMASAYNSIIINGHVETDLKNPTIFEGKSIKRYGLPHWQRDGGTYLTLSDTEQTLRQVNADRI